MKAKKEQTVKAYYVLEVIKDVTPVIHGPYSTAKKQSSVARKLCQADSNLENGIFAIDSVLSLKTLTTKLLPFAYRAGWLENSDMI